MFMGVSAQVRAAARSHSAPAAELPRAPQLATPFSFNHLKKKQYIIHCFWLRNHLWEGEEKKGVIDCRVKWAAESEFS